MKGYWLILGTRVSDPKAQAEYASLWAPIAEKYHAVINPNRAPLLRENRDAERLVVVEFPSLEAAKACYDDPAYQHALKFALQASRRHLVILEGSLA